jgi:ATP-binding protein involved in chromosome partitioning
MREPTNPTEDVLKAALQALGVEEDRLLAADRRGGMPALELASDGWTLDDKLRIEKGLKEALGGGSVYFRRVKAITGPAPKPVEDKKAPFGLTIDRRAIPGVTEIIAVASGKGGVGKSTVSANLAVALAQQGKKVGLLDADIYGPSAPLMMGLSGPLKVQGDKLLPHENHGVKTVSFGFLTDTTQPVIWRGPLIAKAFRQLCYDVAWGELDYLVIDLPPGTGDVQLALIESVPVHAAVLVTTPQDVALLDAHKALSMFQKLDVPVLGLVENMAMHVCSQCGHVEPIFGEGGADRMATERRIPVLARIPLAAPVRLRGDEGKPVVVDGPEALKEPFRQLAGTVIQGVHQGLLTN